MADENLRLQAEVVDKFSGPLKKLRDGLRGIRAPEDLKRTQDAMEGVKKGAEMAANAVRSTLGVALTGLGITSITAGGALAGLFAAAKSFGASAAELKFFSQEVDVSARNIRRLENFGANFNISADQVRSGVGKVSEQMRELRRGYGDLADYLRRIDPDLFNQLRGSKDNDEAMGRLLGYMDRIPNAADRAAFSMRAFGTTAFARMSDIRRGLGNIDKDVAVPTQEAMKAAEQFLAAWNRVGNIFDKIKVQIGTEVMPMFNEWLEGLGKRLSDINWEKVVGDGIVKFKELLAEIQSVGKSLSEVDWSGFGKAAMFVLRELGQFIKDVADAIRDIKKLLSGDFSPLALQRLPDNRTPQPAKPGDNLADADPRVARYNRLIETRRAAGLPVEDLERQRDKLREAVKDGVKEGLQGMIQQQSFGPPSLTGNGWGQGGLFQNASYGPGGASAGPGGFPRMPRLARSPSSGGVGGDDGVGGIPDKFSGAKTFGAKAPEIMRRIMRDFGLTADQAAGIMGNFGHESGGLAEFQEKRPMIPGSRGGWGWAQWTGPRRRAFEAWVAKRGLDPKSDEANYGFFKHEFSTTHKRALDRIRGAGTKEEATQIFEQEFEQSGIKNWRSRFGWADRAKKAYEAEEARRKDAPPLARMGDDLMRSRFANPEITGRAGVDIRLQGFPQGTKVNTSTEGIFQDVRLDRGKQLGAMMA